jgi:cytochrome oxidase Cu insertion factor (SCO1/SenC/PrrC family)
MRFDVVGDLRSSTYTIDHPVAMLLFNPEGRFVTLVPPGVSAAELAADLRNRIHSRKKP